MRIAIGQRLFLNWNGAKEAGNDSIAYTAVRVEAFGADWVIIRAENGRAYAITFEREKTGEEMFAAIHETDYTCGEGFEP